MRDDLTSLARFLGDGARAEGFEEFVTFVDSITKPDAYPNAGPRERVMVRVWSTMCVAAIEAGRKETDLGTDLAEVIQVLAFFAGATAAAAVMTPLKDDVPTKWVKRFVHTQMRAGADWFIDGQKGKWPRGQ